MKKMILRIIQSIRYPFYQAAVDAVEEEFLDDEYKIVWEEAEEAGIEMTIQERIEILSMMDCISHIHQEGIDYFYCQDLDEYWEELSAILDKK